MMRSPANACSTAFSEPAREISRGTIAAGKTTTPRKGNATIISSPWIITKHNTTGSIFVGETRPIASGSVTAGGTGGTTTTITQINIGITLTVSPLIGSDGTVQLTIQQNISDHAGDVTIDGNPQPVISTRTTNSQISCQSGDILVLGGLQRNGKSKSTSMLAGIPILGDLLGARSYKNDKTDLIFFMRPVVMTDSETNTAAAKKRIDGLEQKDTVRQLLEIPPPPPAEKKGSSSGSGASSAAPDASTRRPR